jgi:hypothetical protein
LGTALAVLVAAMVLMAGPVVALFALVREVCGLIRSNGELTETVGSVDVRLRRLEEHFGLCGDESRVPSPR